jgi:alpha-N-acetylglucosamine transferase
MEFFNKNRWALTKLNDQVQLVPNAEFTLITYITPSDIITTISTITGKLVKTNGRTKTELTAVVTVTSLGNAEYEIKATPSSTEWVLTEALTLQLIINGTDSVTVPLVVV